MSTEDLNMKLMDAVRDKNLVEVKRLCEAGADPCVVDVIKETYDSDMGQAALHIASQNSVKREFLDYLLTRPEINVNLPTMDRHLTPMHYTIINRTGKERAELLDKLLELGADPNIACNSGATPIFFFNFFDGAIQVIDRLIAAGAYINHIDNEGNTVLDYQFGNKDRGFRGRELKDYVQMLAHLIEIGAASHNYSMEEIKDYLKNKGTFVRSNDRPVSSTLKKFKAITENKLKQYTECDKCLIIEGDIEPVALFDWFEFVQEELDDESDTAGNIREYHINPNSENHFNNEEWLPFGLVGMKGSEMMECIDGDEDGTLFIDLSRAKGNDAPVVFVPSIGIATRLTKNKNSRDLPETYRELMKTLTDYE